MTQWKNIKDIADEVRSGKVKALEQVEKALANIEYKSDFNAVISIASERAIERAKQIDLLVKNKEKVGRLAGVPFIAKDNFLTFGTETTAASNILKGFNAPYQATVIERLESEGAIMVAKANLDAFAHGSSTENSDFMITKNPRNPEYVPGGSSGGSAAAVVLDLAPFALGTDTGGSIRLPAAFCGAVGYKPTYGLVSRSGVIAMASSTDVIGPITKDVADAQIIMDVIAGVDELDSTTIPKDKSGYSDSDISVSGKKIGLIKEYIDGLDKNVLDNIKSAVSVMERSGAKVEEISMPSLPLALACYYIICPAEVSSNLSRYDGQKYGFTHPDANNLDESYNWSRSEGFGVEAKRRIMIGTYVLSSGYYDAYYKKAQQVRTKIINEFEQAFTKYDFLIGPTAPSTAFKIGANTQDPLEMYLTDIMTVGANLAGNPAISIPSGQIDGLPLGIQIMSAQRKDKELLGFAHNMEKLL